MDWQKRQLVRFFEFQLEQRTGNPVPDPPDRQVGTLPFLDLPSGYD